MSVHSKLLVIVCLLLTVGQCNDYDLVSLTEDCYYYVVSPKDVVVAKVPVHLLLS